MKMLADNIQNAFQPLTHIFWSGGDIAKDYARNISNDVNGITLKMTRLGKNLESMNESIDLWRGDRL